MSGFTYEFSPVLNQSGTFYVSPLGSDTTGTGSQSYPFKTIQKGVDYINSLPAPSYLYYLLIENGFYSETVTFSGQMSVGAASILNGSVFIDQVNFATGCNIGISNIQMNLIYTFGTAIVNFLNCSCEATFTNLGTGTINVIGGDFNSNNICITYIADALTLEMAAGNVGQIASFGDGATLYIHNNRYVRYLEFDANGQFILENQIVTYDPGISDYAFIADFGTGSGAVYLRGEVAFVSSAGGLAKIYIDTGVPFRFDRVFYDVKNSVMLGTILPSPYGFDCTKNTLPNATIFTPTANDQAYSAKVDDYFIVVDGAGFTGCSVSLDLAVIDRRRVEIFNSGTHSINVKQGATDLYTVNSGDRAVATYLATNTTWYFA